MQQIVVESSYGSIWREIMEGIIWFARDRRLAWKVNCVTTQELGATLKLRPGGAICLLRQAQRGLVRQLVASRVPAVNMLREIHPKIPSVMSNNELIGERAADYLHGKGFRHFAYAGVNRIWSEERQRGFTARVKALGREVILCPAPPEVGGLRVVSGYEDHRDLEKWRHGENRAARGGGAAFHRLYRR